MQHFFCSSAKTQHSTFRGGAIEAFNKAASKIPGIEVFEFDLSDYVLAQIMASLGALICEKETTVRAGNVEGMSESVVKVRSFFLPFLCCLFNVVTTYAVVFN